MTEKYFKVQEDIFNKINKAKINFKKSPKDRISVSYVEARLESLEKSWSIFEANHNTIVLELEPHVLKASNYETAEIYEETENLYWDYKALLKSTLSELRIVENKSSPKEVKSSEQTAVKLPKIAIPKFSGQYSEWVSFRDLFTSLIHKNSSIDDVQKLHYLKSSVTGESELLLRHIPVTADNYQVCWRQLESRYNNKRYLANSILKKLVNQKSLTSETAGSIKQLLDTTKECLSALTNIGIEVGSWDPIVIFLISQKLDSESRKHWEQKISDSVQELPSFNQFEEFLHGRFRALEFIDTKGQRAEKPSCHVTATLANCIFCSEGHKLANCKKFAKEQTDARRNFVQTNHLCFNCLGVNHSVYQCTSLTRCRLCKKKHHTLIHPRSPKSNEAKSNQPANSETVESAGLSHLHAHSEVQNSHVVASCFTNAIGQVLLATALVKVESPKTNSIYILRSLLDQGSQASFITEAAVQLIGLKKIPGTSLVSGLGGDQATLSSKSSVVLKIQSRLNPSFNLTVKAHVLSRLTTLLPASKVPVQVLPTLSPTELADPSFSTPNKIDLLLGADVYSQILLEGLIKDPQGAVIAQRTTLGWILSGMVRTDTHDVAVESRHNIISLHLTQPSENEILKKFWEIESEPSFEKSRHLSPEERMCEDIFTRTTRRDQSGRFIVKLPFKTQDPACLHGNLNAIALKRFFMLEKRLLKNPDLKLEFSKVLSEYLSSGHMEVIQPQHIVADRAVYLPYHPVIRQDKTTTKIRMVVDASCTDSNGASLNSDLLVGPRLQPELRHLIMRWRRYKIGLVADIVKMYRQMQVAEEDVDFQRIYWRETPNSEMQHLRFLRVTFGTSSAPYLAVRCLQQLAYEDGNNFPLVQHRVLEEFYMDDLMTGCYSVNEGLQVHEQMTALLKCGGFPLQKWSSNSKELMKELKEESRDPNQNVEFKTDEVVKILGLRWDRETDEFRCTVNLPPLQPPVTKRKMISDIARLFDPLGWIAPAVTTAKVFIQRAWLAGISWDTELPTAMLEDWIAFRNDLCKLSESRFPRWIHSNRDDQLFELHGFADASNVAYAAVVYARIIDKQGRVHVYLLTSKTRVAPVKQISIPRLELCGAVLLAKLLKEVAETLEIPKERWHAWTDSTIVLAWLRSHPSRWKTFVANRVTEILTVSDGDQWHHVVSKDNPADPASRGLQPTECVQNVLWHQGPAWLKLENIDYGQEDVENTNLEEKNVKIKCHTAVVNNGIEELLSRFSKLKKLTRVLSFCRRVLKKPEKESTKSISTWLTAKEINKTLLTCIKSCQRVAFHEDIDGLEKTGNLPKQSKLTSLYPFLDANQILRVGGRIQNAQVSEDVKHSIILPRNSHLTKLIVDDAHDRTKHGGPLLMLNYLRNQYWIIGAKDLVRQYVHRCVSCVRQKAEVRQQLMGQLPAARVTPSRPFLKTGVDYAGPISVRATKGRGHHATKGYICLFECMATKAIHLEIVSDMTSQSFIAAFKRFVARRGHVAEMWSDNGSTFVGCARELKELFAAENTNFVSEIADFMASKGTDWHFIPPHSPNFGGLWEAGVKSTKHHLKRVIGNSTLTFEEMTTTLAQIEACLNSRPICQLSNNPEDPTPLTPGHFLVGEPLLLVPDFNYEAATISSLKRWHLTQRMVQDFWRRWSKEYLTQLQHRYKWSQQVSEPEIGRVVLVKEDNLPPSRWLFGVITEKHPGSDKLTRVVTLRYKGNYTKRPVSKLVILPIDT